MFKKYRDPRRDKIRDLRRAHGLWRKLWQKLHPECGVRWTIRLCDHQLWDLVYNAEDEWIRGMLGHPAYVPHMPGNAPAHYRRTMNKLRRAKDKQAMREQLRDGETDIIIPRHRRDVNWDWF